MEYLLIGGAQSVGKSQTVYRLARNFISAGFIDILGSVPPSFKDFKAVLEGKDINKKFIRVIINSPTDTPEIIQDFFEFYKINGSYDILISSVRDDNFWPRSDFFSIMGINEFGKNVIEIPLAKITRRGSNKNVALNWYKDKIDSLIQHTMLNDPFQVRI